MSIFLTLLSISVILLIFSMPLIIAERWMNRQERTLHSSVRHRNQKQTKDYLNNRKKYTKNSQIHYTLPSLFESIISMQTKIAKSDGVISIAEAAYIKDSINQFIFIAQQNGLNASKRSELREFLVQGHTKAKHDSTLISVYAQRLKKQHFHTKEEILRQLISIAIAGRYTQLKESLIFNAGIGMGFNSIQIRRYIDNLRGFKQESKKPNLREHTHYSVLGCNSTDSNATIKKHYRTLVKKYHTDFMHSETVDEAYLKFAKEKLQEINMAYGQIKKERGI